MMRIILAVSLAGLASISWGAELPADPKLEFRHHFVSLDLPTNQGQGDYGLTALVDLDRDGDLDIGSKPWRAFPWAGAGGRFHVIWLENWLMK